MWAEAVRPDEWAQPWEFLYEQLHAKLHRHRLKLLGVGLLWKDRNLSGALEWDEAEDIEAQLAAVLSSSTHTRTGKPSAVKPEVSPQLCACVSQPSTTTSLTVCCWVGGLQDAVMAAVVWAMSLFQGRNELDELVEETSALRVELRRVRRTEALCIRSTPCGFPLAFLPLTSVLSSSAFTGGGGRGVAAAAGGGA